MQDNFCRRFVVGTGGPVRHSARYNGAAIVSYCDAPAAESLSAFFTSEAGAAG